MQIKITTGDLLTNLFTEFNPIKKDEKLQEYEEVSCFSCKHCHCIALKLCLGQSSCYILQSCVCLLLHSSSQIQNRWLYTGLPVLSTRYCLIVLNLKKFTSVEYYNLIVCEYLQTVAITFSIIMNWFENLYFSYFLLIIRTSLVILN